MTMIDTGTYGAKRQTWKRSSPRDLLKRLIEERPGVSELELQKAFSEQVREEDAEDYLASIIEYWFANNYRSLMSPSALSAERAANRAVAARVKDEVRDKAKAAIRREAETILLDMAMPNGKALRDTTGKECSKFGGWFTKIAAAIKPAQKVSVLSEAKLRQMYRAT